VFVLYLLLNRLFVKSFSCCIYKFVFIYLFIYKIVFTNDYWKCKHKILFNVYSIIINILVEYLTTDYLVCVIKLYVCKT